MEPSTSSSMAQLGVAAAAPTTASSSATTSVDSLRARMRRQSLTRFEAMRKTQEMNAQYSAALDASDKLDAKERKATPSSEDGTATAAAHESSGKQQSSADAAAEKGGTDPVPKPGASKKGIQFGVGTTDLKIGGDSKLKKSGLKSLMERYGPSAEEGRISVPLSRSERMWLRFVRLSCAFDILATPYFIYQGFVLNADDRQMDPLAWQLTFGVSGMMIFFKVVQVLLRVTKYVVVWASFAVFLNMGLFYGAARRWMIIYNGTFPCFKGNKDMFGMCYDGTLLVGMVTGTLYMTCSLFFMQEWAKRENKRLIAEGLMEAEVDIDMLMERAQDKARMHTRADIIFKMQTPKFMQKGFRSKSDQYKEFDINEDGKSQKSMREKRREKDRAVVYKPQSSLLAHLPPTISTAAAKSQDMSDALLTTRGGMLDELQHADEQKKLQDEEEKAREHESAAYGRAKRQVPAGTRDPLAQDVRKS